MAVKFGVIVISDIIERAHLKFCKLLNLKKNTPNYMIYGELGILPMSIFIKSRIVNFWIGTINGKENKLTHILYKSLYRNYENNNVNSPCVTRPGDIFVNHKSVGSGS